MIQKPQHKKHFESAKRRFLQPSIEQFLEEQCPKTFGPLLRERLAEKIVDLVKRQLPPKDHLSPGQVVWNAVSKDTRPNSPNVKFVPVILTLIDSTDINDLTNGKRMSSISKKAIARITKEAYQQDALLSMRDIGLLTWRNINQISILRLEWERENKTSLPHPGSIQDFGSCISHKSVIIRKAIVEKKDPKTVAYESKHSQRAVDRYLKDFHRVKTCYDKNNDIDFICQVTGLSRYLVKQYIEIILEIAAKIT